MGTRPDSHVFAPNGLNDFVGWSSEQFGYDRKLIDVIFAGKQRFAFQHLGEYASGAPDIDLDVVLLPCEHNLRRTVVPRRHVSRHLRILDSRQTKITNLQVAVLVDQDIAWLEVSMNDSGGMHIFQTTLPPLVS